MAGDLLELLHAGVWYTIGNAIMIFMSSNSIILRPNVCNLLVLRWARDRDWICRTGEGVTTVIRICHTQLLIVSIFFFLVQEDASGDYKNLVGIPKALLPARPDNGDTILDYWWNALKRYVCIGVWL